MKCNEPIEVRGAIPLSVSRFARDLSRFRRLDVAFQSECRLANRERVNWDENIQFFDGLSGVLDFHKFLMHLFLKEVFHVVKLLFPEEILKSVYPNLKQF